MSNESNDFRNQDPKFDQTEDRKKTKKRQDHGRMHAVRNSLLTRGLLNALRGHGQNMRQLRETERALRNALRPSGPLGDLFFDKFWASVLRLILCSQLESAALADTGDESSPVTVLPELHRKSEPMLMLSPSPRELSTFDMHPSETDLLHQLSLIARYDRAASREMYRCLSLLLLLRDAGDGALTDWAAATAGTKLKENANG